MQNDAPLLSDAETSALLEAMRGAQHAVQPAATPVDLVAADRPLRDALLPADRAADGFAQQIIRPLLRQLGVACTAEPEPAEITPFDVFRASIPTGAIVALVTSESGAPAFVTIGPSLASQVLDRRLGATPKGAGDVLWLDGPEPTMESLSSVDCRILRPFAEDVLATFTAAWCTAQAKIELKTLYQRADQLTARSRSEPLLRMSWRAAPFGQRGDRIEVAMTAPFLHDTHPPARATGTPVPAGERVKIIQRLRAAPIRLAARLGSCPATVRELLALSTGDVLRLDTVVGSPIDVLAGSRRVATGQPIVEHGNLAVEIVGVAGRDDGRP